MYLMAYQTDVPAVHLALSADGLAWRGLRDGRPVLEGGPDGLHGPCLLSTPDAALHVLATEGPTGPALIHAASADGRDWSNPTRLHVADGIDACHDVTDPACYWDAEHHLARVVWTSRTGSGAAARRALWAAPTRDFATMGPTVSLFDPGYDVAQPDVLAAEGLYVLAFRDDRGDAGDAYFNAIRTAASRMGAGPFVNVSSLLTPHDSAHPALLHGDAGWLLLFELDGAPAALASATGTEWVDVSARLDWPAGARQVSVCRIADALAAALE